MNTSQFTIDFSSPPSFEREDFILGGCNAIAADWIDRWPDWPGRIPGVFLLGPADAGKSHLAAIWMKMSNASLLKKLSPDDLEVLGPAPHVALDHPLPGPSWPEDILFHLLNRISEGGSLLVLSRVPAAEMGWSLADVASRMAGLVAAEITTPDDSLLTALVQKHADDLGLALDGEVVRYIVGRMERSFSSARAIIAATNALALARKKKVTISMAREVLDQQQPRLL